MYLLLTHAWLDMPWGALIGACLLWVISSLAQAIVIAHPPNTAKAEHFPPSVELLSSRFEKIHRRSQKMDLDFLVENHLAIFARLLVEPHRMRRRVKEELKFLGATVEKSIELDLHISEKLLDDSAGRRIAIPLMRPLKGRLISGLHIQSGDGPEISTLNAEETLAYILRVMRTLLVDAFGAKLNQESWPIEQQFRDLYCDLIEMVLLNPSSKDMHEPRLLREQIGDAFEKATRGMEIVKPDSYVTLRDLVRHSATNYSIVALIPAGNRSIVNYQYIGPLEPFADVGEFSPAGWALRWLRLKGYIRGVLGGTPRFVDISIGKARRCESYHLSLSLPSNSYVQSADIVTKAGAPLGVGRSGPYNLGGPHFRLLWRGVPNLYLYARGARKINEPLRLRIQLGEKPPGGIGRAVVVSGLITAAIGLVGSRADVSKMNVDSGALIVAVIPMALLCIAFIIGIRRDGPSVISYAALTSGLLSGMEILAAACLLVVASTSTAEVPADGFGNMSTNAWSMLFSFATCQTLLFIGVLITRSIRLQLGARPEDTLDDDPIKITQ